MEKLKSLLVDELASLIKPKTIYEKSGGAARAQEGSDAKFLLYGTESPEVIIVEDGISYIIPILAGQKTGFFLDQREMRKKIRELSAGKKFLTASLIPAAFLQQPSRGSTSCP